MEISSIAEFWFVSLIMIMIPGADWAYAISAGINGHRVLSAVAGLIFGHMILTCSIVAGVGVLVAQHLMVLNIITLFGAGYLLWLGINILRHPANVSSANVGPGTSIGWALRGICISGLNPKVFLLFLALLPQFTDLKGEWSLVKQMLILSIIHLITCTLIYIIVGYSSKAVLTTRPHIAYYVSMASGGFIILIATILFYQQIALYLSMLSI